MNVGDGAVDVDDPTFLTQHLKLTEDIITGYFGIRTEEYVKQLQARANLEQVGYAGSLTRAYIERVCSASR